MEKQITSGRLTCFNAGSYSKIAIIFSSVMAGVMEMFLRKSSRALLTNDKGFWPIGTNAKWPSGSSGCTSFLMSRLGEAVRTVRRLPTMDLRRRNVCLLRLLLVIPPSTTSISPSRRLPCGAIHKRSFQRRLTSRHPLLL